MHDLVCDQISRSSQNLKNCLSSFMERVSSLRDKTIPFAP